MKIKKENVLYSLHLIKVHFLFLKLIIIKVVYVFMSKIFH